MFSVPRTACVGSEVALFELPFEARAKDTVSKELYDQLACHKSRGTWFAPSASSVQAEPVLAPTSQPSAGPAPWPLKRRKRRNPPVTLQSKRKPV